MANTKRRLTSASVTIERSLPSTHVICIGNRIHIDLGVYKLYVFNKHLNNNYTWVIEAYRISISIFTLTFFFRFFYISNSVHVRSHSMLPTIVISYGVRAIVRFKDVALSTKTCTNCKSDECVRAIYIRRQVEVESSGEGSKKKKGNSFDSRLSIPFNFNI